MIKTMWKSTQDQRGDSSIGFVHYIYWQVIHSFQTHLGALIYPIYGQGELPQAFCCRSAVKGCIYERPKSKTSPPPSRPKPKTDDVSLIPSLSLVPLLSSSPSDQGSKPKTDDVSLAPHGDSSAFSAETDDRNQGRLCWSSRSLVALLSSSPSDQGSKPKTDDVSLAPHRDSSAFSAETDDRNRGRLCWSSRSPVALLSSSPSDQGSKPRTEDVSLAPHGDSSYFM
ncbi:unnamed protein product [Brassica oleracea var. botrytis]